jgi:hypothetical protein
MHPDSTPTVSALGIFYGHSLKWTPIDDADRSAVRLKCGIDADGIDADGIDADGIDAREIDRRAANQSFGCPGSSRQRSGLMALAQNN